MTKLNERFRGFLPVVVDVETSGVNPCKNAILEIAINLIDINAKGEFFPAKTCFEAILPFKNAELDPKSLEFTGIVDPFYPLRFAVDEACGLKNIFDVINHEIKKHKCNRAVLVGHNAWFDLLFLKQASKRTKITLPFHSFTCFDTATLAGFVYGQTVLSKAMQAGGISFNANEAHSAIYDAEKTAELFCKILNIWQENNLLNKLGI